MPDGHRKQLVVVRGSGVLMGKCAIRTRGRWDDIVVRIQIVWLVAIPTVHASTRRSDCRGLLKGRKRWCRMNRLPGYLRGWAVVSVNVAGFARRLSFSPFRPSVLSNDILKLRNKFKGDWGVNVYLEPHLNPRFTQIKFQRQLFTCENVGVRGPFKCSLELFKLVGGECRSANIGKHKIVTAGCLIGIEFVGYLKQLQVIRTKQHEIAN